jgi:DNA-binding response OmpR family regulator
MHERGRGKMKKHPCILAVDDEQAILTLLGRILEPEGYSVVVANNGRVALELMEECCPDLVILDIMLPGLDGFQVLDLIRQRFNIPVIMLTGRGEVTTLRDALELGADDFVRKPFYTRELLARIKAKLRRTEPTVTSNEGGWPTTDRQVYSG